MKILFHKYKDILFILLIGIIVPLLWYGSDPNTIIASHDVGSFLNPVELAKTRLFTWYSGINFGRSQTDASGSIIYYGLEALGAFLTGSVFTGQKIVVILWFIFPMLVLYILLQKIPVFKNKPYMAFFAALIFQFNHFQQQGWRVFWRTRFSTYILLPIILILLIDYLEGRRKLLKTAVYIGLSVFLLNGGGSPPVFGANILLVLVTIFYYLLINFRNNFIIYLKRSILFILAGAVSTLLMSSFWFIPYLYNSLKTYSQIVQSMGGVSASLAWTDVVSQYTSTLNLLRNVGLLFWDTSSGDPHLFFANPILIIFSFIWPILTFSAIFFAKKHEEKKYVILFLLFAVIGLIFTAGTHPPFRSFYVFFLNYIPGYVIFRSPLYKFGNLLWFSYAVLIAFSLSSIFEKIKSYSRSVLWSKFLPLFFLSFILLWDYPVFKNQFFDFNKDFSTVLKIPPYVFDFGNWMDKNIDPNARTLLLPDSDKNWRWEVYRWRYSSFGSQLIPFLTTKNTISNDVSALDMEQTIVMLDKLYELIKNNDPIWLTIARKFNIRYLILRRDYYYDLDWMPTTQPNLYEKILAQESNVEKIKTSGEWDLYRIKTDIPVEKIYLVNKPVFYSQNDDNIILPLSIMRQKGLVSSDNIHLIPAKGISNNADDSQNVIVAPSPIDSFLPVGNDGLVLPKTEFLPDSPLYFLVDNKERELLKNAVMPEDMANIYIDLSLNRLAELNEFINLKVDLKKIENVSSRYILLLNDMKRNIDKLLQSKKDTDRIAIRSKGFLIEEKKLFKMWINEQSSQPVKNILGENLEYLEGLIKTIPVSQEQEAVLSGMIKPFSDSDIVFLTEGYKWRAPVNGLYEIYLGNSSLLNNSGMLTIQIDNQTVESKKDKRQKEYGWQKIGEVNLSEGDHGLQIVADGNNIASIRKGDIVFVKIGHQKDSETNPKISYRRINSTKYIAEIPPNNPFFLIFDEKYNPGWKVYLKEKSAEKSKFSIVENIIGTLFLTPLPEAQHIKADGYANAWLIDPSQNLQGKEYEAVIEYWPQRIFYLSFLITIIAVSGGTVFLIISGRKQS